jgi:hypothetical protein
MRSKRIIPFQEHLKRLKIEFAVSEERASRERKKKIYAFEVVIGDVKKLISVHESADAQNALETLRDMLEELRTLDKQEADKWKQHYLASKFSI